MANPQDKSRQLQLDDFDFGSDFDVDFDFDLTPKPPQNKREAIWRVASGAKNSLANNLKSPTFFQTIVKNALPRNYGQAWDLAEKSAGTLRDLYNDSVREIKPVLRDIARTTEKLMPTADKYLPKGVAEQLREFSKKYTPEREPTGLGGSSAEDTAVADILGKMYRFTAESDTKRTMQGDIKDNIRENIQQERHIDQIAQLDSIRGSVNQMAAYQRKIEYNYHRKSLELQARSYFISVESLREQKRQNLRNTEHLAAILHNTALPDYVKMKTSEQFMQQTKNKFMGKISDGISNSLFGRRAGFINNIREAAKKHGSLAVKNAGVGLRAGLFSANQVIDELADKDSPIDKYTAGGHFIGSTVSNFINKQISKYLSKGIENDPNGLGKKVRRVGNKLQYGVENLPQHLAEFSRTTNGAEDYMQSALDKINNKFGDPISYAWQRRLTGAARAIGNPALDFGRNVLREASTRDTQIKEGNVNSLTEPAVFNNQARKSLTEIIPGYLARIHQELRILRTGDASVDMVQYNFDKNAFDTSTGVKKTIFNKLVPKTGIESAQQDLDRVLNMLDPNNTLNAKQRKVLGNRFMQDNLNGSVGRTGSLSRYASSSQFNGSDEERKHAEIFAKLFKDLKLSDKEGLKQVEFAQKFSRIGQSGSDVNPLIQQYSDTDHRAALEEIGILEPGSNKINQAKLLEYQSGKRYRPSATHAGGSARASALITGTPPVMPQEDHSVIHQGFDSSPITDGLKSLGRDLMALDSRPKLGDIHDTLKLMQARLEEGILTVPYEQVMGELKRIQGSSSNSRKSLLKRMGSKVTSLGGLLTMSVGDLIKGSARAASKIVGFGGRLGSGLVSGGISTLGKVAGFGLSGMGAVAGNVYRRQRGFIDIYVGNERKPRMYARMLQQGDVYFNRDTNKPVRKFSDITGTIVSRISGEEKVVLEEDEIKDAWQKEGLGRKLIKTLGAGAKLASKVGGTLFGIATGGIPLVYRAALWGAKKAYGLLDMPQDVYVKGGDGNPVLLARVMRNGGYRSATTGKPITRPSQIDGPVLVSSGAEDETVLTHDDIRKGLVDSRGKPLRTGLAKLFNLATGGISTAFGAAKWLGNKAFSAAGSLLKGGWKLGKGIVKTGVNVLGFGLDRLRGKPLFEGMYGQAMMASLSVAQEGNHYLKEIRDLLDQRLAAPKKKDWSDTDGDGVRDGSYEDQVKKQKEKEKKDDDKTKTAQGGRAVGAAGGGFGLKSLWNKLRGKKDGDDGNGGIDINVGGGKDPLHAPKGKPSLPQAKPKGFWGKTKHYAKSGLKYAGKALSWGADIAGGLAGLEALGVGTGLMAGAGSAIAAGAATVGSVVLAGATATAAAAASIISAPVLIGAAAVAALAIGGYYAYKAITKRRLGLMSRVRYVQYGFGPKDDDHVGAVFALEDKLKEAITYGEKGAQISDKQFDIKKILADFDVKMDDKQAVRNWFAWFNGRFKPVFLTHATALRSAAANKWLSEVDSLETPLKKKYLASAKFPEGPYGVTDSPFKDLKTLPSGAGDVKAIIQLVEMELDTETKKDGKSATVTQAGVAGGVAGAKGVGTKPNAATAGTKSGVNPAVLSAAAASTINTSGLSDTRGQVTVAGSSTVLESLGANRIDPVTAVRYKTYGLTKMEADKVRVLATLEKAVGTDVVFNNKVASWTGSLEAILKNCAPSFGVEVSDSDHSKAWLIWFNRRFLPTFLNFITAVSAQTGKQDYAAAAQTLKPLQMTEVATAIYTTITKADGSSRSVWTVTESPWVNYDLSTDVKITDPNMQGLKEMSKNAILPESGTKAPATNSKGSNGTSTTAPGAKPASTGVSGFFSGIATSVSNFFTGKKSSPPTSGAAGASASPGSGGNLVQPGKGTGGDINAIPLPKGNKSWAAVKDTILAAAKMVGVDGKLLAAMAAVESDFDYTVRNKVTSATGLFQFVDKTWNYMLKKHAAKYGISPNTPSTDPRANALMGAEYFKESVNSLEGKIGRALTDTDVYISHFLGPGGAHKFLTADANAIGSSVMPDAAASNKDIFFEKNGKPRTVGEIYQVVASRLRNKAKGAINDGGEEMVASTPPVTTPSGTSPPVAKPSTASTSAPSDTSTKTGIGASTATPAVAVTAPTPSTTPQKTADIPVSAEMSGFTAPTRAMNDINQQSRMQQEMKIVGIDVVGKTLTDSLEVQKGMSDLLGKILAAVSNGAGQGTSAPAGTPQSASNDTRQQSRERAAMKPSPVSMSRTMLNN